jgi:hypothetical protein
MSQIINSHYVPLQPPYPIIYCNGEVGNGKSTNSLPTGIYILHDGRSTKKVIIK